MLVSFLFWNLMKRPLQDRAARLVRTQGIDILILAECEISTDEFLSALTRETGQTFHCPKSQSNKVLIFTRFAEPTLVDQFNDATGGVTMRRLRIKTLPEVLLAAVHLPSKVNYDEDDQLEEAKELAADIARVEQDTGIRRTILVGDLNMNPFEPGVSMASALHAVMTKRLAAKSGGRIERGKPYRFFYNPMWGYFGDRADGPPGTYYFSASKKRNYFWNMYDQVLLRPELMHTLQELQILDSDGVESLVTASGIPDKLNASDHLPLLFRLEL